MFNLRYAYYESTNTNKHLNRGIGSDIQLLANEQSLTIIIDKLLFLIDQKNEKMYFYKLFGKGFWILQNSHKQNIKNTLEKKEE